MKRLIIILCALMFFGSSAMRSQAGAKELSGAEILDKLDQAVNASKDQVSTVQLILIDRTGNERTREMIMYQKGSDRRMVKFLSPADQRGIGVLSLPGDTMMLYLPAFKKTRKIASHVKNTKFSGTDFTYEDMEAKKYSEKFSSELLKKEGDLYVIELKPKKGTQSDYSRLVMRVRPDIFYATEIEYYNKGNKLSKIMKADKIENIKGYWIARETEMEDVIANHKTKMIIKDVKFDTGLSDGIFSERYLKR